MDSYDQYVTASKATVWHGDGHEKTLQTHILSQPSLCNQPEAILSEIDRWATEKNICMMTIGPERSTPIMDLINSARPSTMAELGGYVGYSAIKFGNEVRRVGGTRYLSLEFSDEYAAVAKALIEFAELGDFTQVIVGPASESLGKVAEELQTGIDVLFIDHYERLYLGDLKTAEGLGLLKVGAFVVADNVDAPGAKDYMQWVDGREEDEGRRFKYESQRLPYMLANGQQLVFQDALWISKLI
ncbi:O-methyltransferase [Aspergillus affinis]|uniref:O-methyltransferase n=1 Tax=Aspergillus affinis TaxID=1070780 RepID=UPI0022FEEE4F|nr:catechol o methyltransferase [Aspergillus affinis]KAI9044949.1 catechol o methyltransferase [Aspergillus affinis]